MQCPRDRSDLKAQSYEETVEIDRCPSCLGIWLDSGELQSIQNATERRHLHMKDDLGDTVVRSFHEAGQLKLDEGPCPRCGEVMVRQGYGFGSQIVLDTCPAGCGLWLDKGELQELEAFYEQSHADVDGVLPLSIRVRELLYAMLGKRSAKKV